MTDTLETAAACGAVAQAAAPRRAGVAARTGGGGLAGRRLRRLIASWFPLTYVLNNLNRGLGLPDAYPFVLSPPAVEKLRLVHDVIAASAATAAATAASTEPAPPMNRAAAAGAGLRPSPPGPPPGR